MSVIFPPAILRLEMAVPILWAPGISWFFLLENPSNSSFWRGGRGVFGRGVEVPITNFYGRGDVSDCNNFGCY